MAQGVFTEQTDFRQFNISSVWQQRTDVTHEAAGPYDFLGVNYNSIFFVDYQPPDFSDGRFRLYGDNLVQGATGNLTGGTVRAMRDFNFMGFAGDEMFRATGLSVSAAAVHTAMRTAGLADDQALLLSMFRGNDTISLSVFSDLAYGADGNDTMFGNNGNDRLFGQAGADQLRGGYGNDSLYGNLGADQLIGGPGVDALQGGVGNDTLTGGGGVDRFEFKAGDNNDRVLDWVDGVDELRFYGPVSTITVDLDELAGGHVRLTVLGLQIVVENAEIADFQLISGSGYISLV